MKTVLIIEDNENNMELMSFILESAGYEILKATTGADGFNLAVEKKPDFIIQDIQLPDLNGDEVVRKLREQQSTASIPIIAMTSYAMSDEHDNLILAGCTGYIEKPIDPDRILIQIREILERKK